MGEIKPFDLQEYHRRRRDVMRRMKEGVALFLAPEGGDVHGPYRTTGDLLYLLGLNEPQVALVLVVGSHPEVHLFLRPLDRHDEVWNGPRRRAEESPSRFGVDAVHPYAKLETLLVQKLAGRNSASGAPGAASSVSGRKTLWASLGDNEQTDRVIRGVLRRIRNGLRGGLHHLPIVREPGVIVHPLRWIKSAAEMDRMRRAARITAASYARMIGAIRPGVNEGEISGLLEYGFRQDGGEGPSYSSIVGSGVNACYLHYRKNDRVMRQGELLLVDAGGLYQQYPCDVSRTYPVSGRFTPIQAKVYDIVLAAQLAGISQCRPGRTHAQVHRAAVETLIKGLMALKVLKRGSVGAAIKQKTFIKYYPHGTGHWLGMDGHDVGPYTTPEGKSTVLKPGVVLTVEPGLYFNPSEKGFSKELRGMGIRIEDDILITSSGHEVLTRAIPKTRGEIESIMRRNGSA